MRPELELRNGSKLCVVMAYDETFRELGDLTSGVNLEYCRKANYDFRVYTSGFDKTRPLSWSKLLFVRKCIEDYEWVLWMDADVIVTDHKVRVAKFLELGGVLTICRDIPRWGLNAGVFILRRCDRAMTFLDTVWKTGDPSVRPWEQETIRSYALTMGPDIVVYPTRSFNSFVSSDPEHTDDTMWKKGDFVAHCLGTGMGEKLAMVMATLKKANLLER